MNKKITIGCSSFNNRYWKGVFYPDDLPASQWFDYYCRHFNTYEMNGTFYRFPTLKVMENWYHKAPDDFLFSVKVPKEITHIKKCVDCDGRIAEFYNVCEKGLKDKLDSVLFQFPPSYDYQPQRLEDIIAALHPDFNNVVEFRHESWWIPEVLATLTLNGITFCSVSYPKLPPTIFTDYPKVYIRLHGTPKLFYSTYTSDELAVLKEVIVKTVRPQKVTVFFNNTASIYGIENALELKELLLQTV